MRILLDECLPRQLRRDLIGHESATVGSMGWAGTKNGALLRRAESQFDIFLTADRNLQHQQNLQNLQIAIVVMVAADTQVETLRPLIPQVLVALQTIRPGEVISVGLEIPVLDDFPNSPIQRA